MSITNLDDYVIIILREPFGRAICPFSFIDIVSEPVIDLGYNLLAYADWYIKTLYSPYINSFNLSIVLAESVSIGPVLLVDIVVSLSSCSRIDNFIDNIIVVEYLDNN